MCIYSDNKVTSKLKKQDSVVAYKILEMGFGKYEHLLVSPVFLFPWKPGWNKAIVSTTLSQVHKQDDIINSGIFVFLNEKDAKSHWISQDGDNVVVPVKCLIKDLIGAGYEEQGMPREEQAVFKRVFLPKKDYK